MIAKGGQEVRIAGDTLAYRVYNPKDEEEHLRAFAYDLCTKETTPLPVSAHVDDPGLCGAEFNQAGETWCVGGADDEVNPEPAVLMVKEVSGRTTEFAPFPVDSLNAPFRTMSSLSGGGPPSRGRRTTARTASSWSTLTPRQ